MKTYCTKEHGGAALKALGESVGIPSVCNEAAAEKGAPFGPEIRRALEHALETCRTLGMTVFIDPEGYYGYADYGRGEETVGVVGHLDVVPAGNPELWETPAFEASLRGGRLYGRGTQDDKGPTFAALFALKAVIDAGAEFKRRVRFIFATDEENLWRDIPRYIKNEELPDFGFVPDADFPLVFAEKGLLQFYVTGEGRKGAPLSCGEAFNVVPDRAVYRGENAAAVRKALVMLGFEHSGEGETVDVAGKSAHAKDAPEGINAAVRLAAALVSAGETHPLLRFLAQAVGQDGHGIGIFGEKISDDVSGALTLNAGKLETDGEKSRLAVDVRIPVKADAEDVIRRIREKCAQYGLGYEEHDRVREIYAPEDGEPAKTLLAVYREVSGDDKTPPLASGGATFARALKNHVSFGMAFPDTVPTEHQPNEYVETEAFFRAMEIYAHAIARLCT